MPTLRIAKIIDIWRLTIEINIADILQQLLAPSLFHLWTDASVVSAEIFVHMMEGMSHCIDCINHKLNFTFLFIVGIFSNSLLSCTLKQETRTHKDWCWVKHQHLHLLSTVLKENNVLGNTIVQTAYPHLLPY